MSDLIHELIFRSAGRVPEAEALACMGQRLNYAALAAGVRSSANALLASHLRRGDRVAVYMEKRIEAALALFGASMAGGVFVPVNPLLKPEQVAYILGDCNVKILVTSTERLKLLAEILPHCVDLQTVLVVGPTDDLIAIEGVSVVSWEEAIASGGDRPAHRGIDADMAAILYTSGSTGKPKGVVLSHRNMMAGAASVASYLENTSHDRILAVLPLSFDYGLSQLTTAFHAGAAVVLMNYLLPRDIVRAVETEQITGLAAVPPLWVQLARLDWSKQNTLRYITNSGGAMQRATLDSLRKALPDVKPYLMYGLTEAFRSTFLPPSEVDHRPTSIGKAIPNAEILVLRPDGSRCEPGEPGELVHRGALVSMGYWNDPDKTAERFRPVPSPHGGLPMAELAVWSGDTVCTDDDGFLYFIGRDDEMIKTSGYRVSPMEVEEVLYDCEHVGEAAAVGVPHPVLGQAIVAIVAGRDGMRLDEKSIAAECKRRLPSYMQPGRIIIGDEALPRNANGKIDRKLLRLQVQSVFAGKNETETRQAQTNE